MMKAVKNTVVKNMSKQSDEPIKLESGDWEGEYIDVNGHRGPLRLNLEVKDNTLQGKYELTIRTEDKPQVISGEIEGDVKGENAKMLLAQGREREKMQFDVHVRSAGSFAKGALFGLVGAAPGSNFGGGVWIAWRFAKTSREKR